MDYHIDTCKRNEPKLDSDDTLHIHANGQFVAELNKLKTEAIRNMVVRAETKIDAIRDYRALTGVSLFDAKHTIDGVVSFYGINL